MPGGIAGVAIHGSGILCDCEWSASIIGWTICVGPPLDHLVYVSTSGLQFHRSAPRKLNYSIYWGILSDCEGFTSYISWIICVGPSLTHLVYVSTGTSWH